MKLLVILAATLSTFHFLHLPKNLAKLGTETQNICHDLIPNPSTEHSTLASLVCGKKVSDPTKIFVLQATGLIHVFVVSAGHLVVISEILIFLLGFWRWSSFLLTLVLLAFTLMTGLQAPCVRSLVSLMMGSFLARQKLFLSGPQVVFFTGLLTLALFPNWCRSFSLQLSWIAALALASASTFMNKKYSSLQSLTITSFWVFVLLLPFLQNLGGLHPLSILWNITLGSMTAFFLFPLCILAFLNPFFLKILEFVMTPFWSTLQLSHEFQLKSGSMTSSHLKGWAWILILHLIFHLLEIFYKRTYKT